MEKDVVSLIDFKAGMLSALEDVRIPKNGAKVAKNCFIEDDGTVQRRLPQSFVQSVGDSGDRIINHCLFAKSDGTKYDVIATDAGKVYYKIKSSPGSSFTELTGFGATFGDDYDIRMASYSNFLWLVDGQSMYRWDGATLTDVSNGVGAPNELLGTDFPDPSYIAQSQGAIFLAGFAADPAALYHSIYVNDNGEYITPDNEDAWDNSQVVKIQQEGEIITGLANYRDRLIIFTRNKVYVLAGYIAEINPQLKAIYSEDGCIDDNSIAEVDGKLHWVGEHGVYVFDGQSIQIVSQGIKDYFEWLKYEGLYKYSWQAKTQNEFDDFERLDNADIDSDVGSILTSSFPAAIHSVIDSGTGLAGSFGGARGFAQKITLSNDIEDFKVQLRAIFQFSGGTGRITCYLMTQADGISADTYSAYVDPSSSSEWRDFEFDFAGTSLPAGDYYIKFYVTNSNPSGQLYLEVKKWEHDGYDGDSTVYYSNDNSDWYDFYRDSDARTGLGFAIIPDYTQIETDVFTLADCTTLDRVIISYASGYHISDSNVIKYRYSTTSASDCRQQTYTEISNAGDIGFDPGTTVYVQISVNLYPEDTGISAMTFPGSFAGIDAILVTYTTGTAVSIRLYATSFEKRYFLSMPLEGVDHNTIVLVKSLTNAWTYYELPTYCLWEDNNLLYYGGSASNSIFVLESSYESLLKDWNAETDWEDYELDSNCDDDADSGSLQADYTADEIDDEFTGSSLDDKWTESGIDSDTTVSVTDGKLKVETAGGTADYWNIYQNCSDDSERATDYTLEGSAYLQGADGDAQTYIGIDLSLGDDDGFDFNQNSINVRYDEANEYLYFYSVIETPFSHTDGVVVNGITTCPDVVYLRVVFTWDATAPTVKTYYKIEDAGSWTLAYEKDISSGSYNINTIHVDRVRIIGYNYGDADPKYTEMGYITLTPGIEISSSIEYYDDAYRIYSHNTDGDNTLYWEATNTSTQNTIKIYYSSRLSGTAAHEPTINDMYDWTLLATIEDDNETGSVALPDSVYKYIKVVLDNPDSSYSPLLDRLYIQGENPVEMIWETGYLDAGTPMVEKYFRKLWLDMDSESNYTVYYKTEKMDTYRRLAIQSTEERATFRPEHGKRFKLKVVATGNDEFIIRSMSILYSMRKLR